MNRLDKMSNVICVVIIMLITIGIIWFIIKFKEMLNDHRCYELPINEFFQDKKCEKYWKYK